jgi:hypothetical protein
VASGSVSHPCQGVSWIKSADWQGKAIFGNGKGKIIINESPKVLRQFATGSAGFEHDNPRQSP